MKRDPKVDELLREAGAALQLLTMERQRFDVEVQRLRKVVADQNNVLQMALMALEAHNDPEDEDVINEIEGLQVMP